MKKNSVLGVIPARYASTRLPGKPLLRIGSKTMLQRVYEQSKKSASLDHVIIATDDERILHHAENIGAEAVMTSSHHPSGTDRCWEAYQRFQQKFDYVVNIQGDEPFLSPIQIDTLCSVCDGETEIATLQLKVNSEELLWDMGEVKIVSDLNDNALYFSRSVIPFLKNVPQAEWHLHHSYFRHVGMYAFRSDILEKVAGMQVSTLESAESLEQLRWLQNGFTIKLATTTEDSYCVDSEEDAQWIIEKFGHSVD